MLSCGHLGWQYCLSCCSCSTRHSRHFTNARLAWTISERDIDSGRSILKLLEFPSICGGDGNREDDHESDDDDDGDNDLNDIANVIAMITSLS